jgi:hypothetical protein
MRHLNELTLKVCEACQVPGGMLVRVIGKIMAVKPQRVAHFCEMARKAGLMTFAGEGFEKRYTSVKGWREIAAKHQSHVQVEKRRRTKIDPKSDEPCTAFACVNKERCARERLACTAYRHFVETGIVCNPTTVFHYNEEGKYLGCTTRMLILPTWKIYQSCGFDL